MRVTKRTNIALRLLMFCALNPGRLITKSEIATRCDVSENHLAQIINQLGQLGYLETQRGRKGGIRLAIAADDIQIGEVFRDIEGPPPPLPCYVESDGGCAERANCELKETMSRAAQAFYDSFEGVTLQRLVKGQKETLGCLQQ